MKWLKKNEDKKGQFIFGDYINEYAHILLLFSLVSPIVGIFIVKVLKLGSYENGEPTGDVFTNLGVFGDFLGGSTLPFLTLVTIAYVYKTFKLQEEQLKTQKEEMRMTRETLEEQNKTTRMQRFENSFFKHLEEIRTDKGINFGTHDNKISMGKFLIKLANTYTPSMEYRLRESGIYNTPGPNNYAQFFDTYASFADTALKDANFYDKRMYSFSLKINRVFELIYQYKGSMDEWEIEFYLDYLMDEIDSNAWNIVLLHNCITEQKHMKSIIKELKLDNRIHLIANSISQLDIHFISYIVHGYPYYIYE